MSILQRSAWIVCLSTFFALFFFVQLRQFSRVTYVTSLAGGAGLRLSAYDRAPATEVQQRNLIIPEHNESSYHWLLQTEQAAVRGKWIVGRVDYDNAPIGRPVWAPSPYRWWLALVAFVDRQLSRTSYGVSFERAALVADPLLLLLGLVVLGFVVHRRLGGMASLLLAIGGVSLFPLASAFLPGAPDVRGLVTLLVLSSVVLLLTGHQISRSLAIESGKVSHRQQERCFLAAGVSCALLTWISLTTGLTLIAATIIGAFVARIWSTRESWRASELRRAWRTWAIAGSAMHVLAYLIDYVPRGGGFFRLDNPHPLYAFAWIGAVEFLLGCDWQRISFNDRAAARRWLRLVLAAVPLVAVFWIRIAGVSPGPEKDLLWAKLANLPSGAVAPSLLNWIKSDGFSTATWGTLLPLLMLPVCLWSWRCAVTDAFRRSLLCVLLGIVVAFIAFAAQQLGWWCNLDVVLLAFAVATAALNRPVRQIENAILAVVLIAAGAVGLSLIRLREPIGPNMTITAAETTQLVERDLAHWLAERFTEKRLTVFAPPRETTALCYYGDFKGIGTFAPENRAGFGTALSIVGAATMEEVEALVRARDIRCLVIPSWDPFLEDFARLYLSVNYSNRTSLLVRELRNWNLPLWLRPMAYQMPAIPGFEKHSALVFEVVEPQTPALAASRTAECLAELGEFARAKRAADSLRRFPGDVGALAARVNVQFALNDSTAVEESAAILKTRLQTRADRYLAWDRRVSLAVALAQIGALDLAKEEVERCLKDADEKKIRALSTGSLYRLLVLAKSLELQFADSGLRELSVRLLPAEARAQL